MIDTDDAITTIIKKMKNLREIRGMSQLDLSLASGISQTSISQIESGKKKPSLATFLKLCDALGVSPESVLSSAVEDSEKRKKDKRTLLEIIEHWL